MARGSWLLANNVKSLPGIFLIRSMASHKPRDFFTAPDLSGYLFNGIQLLLPITYYLLPS